MARKRPRKTDSKTSTRNKSSSSSELTPTGAEERAKKRKKTDKKTDKKADKQSNTIYYQALMKLHGQKKLVGVAYDEVTSYPYCHILINAFRNIWYANYQGENGDVTVKSITDKVTRKIIDQKVRSRVEAV